MLSHCDDNIDNTHAESHNSTHVDVFTRSKYITFIFNHVITLFATLTK